MSELKEYLCVEALVPYTKVIPGYLFRCAKYRAPQAEMELVYLKSEVDIEIAEKDAEITGLKKQLHDLCTQSMDVSGKTIDKVSELMDENERLKNEPCNDGEKCNAYWKLYAENESLKKEISDITDGFCDSTHMHIEELRHHKYKRCLTMARWCASRSASWCLDPADEQLHKSDFYDKWKKRWLELAEKFKPNKSTLYVCTPKYNDSFSCQHRNKESQ